MVEPVEQLPVAELQAPVAQAEAPTEVNAVEVEKVEVGAAAFVLL